MHTPSFVHVCVCVFIVNIFSFYLWSQHLQHFLLTVNAQIFACVMGRGQRILINSYLFFAPVSRRPKPKLKRKSTKTNDKSCLLCDYIIHCKPNAVEKSCLLCHYVIHCYPEQMTVRRTSTEIQCIYTNVCNLIIKFQHTHTHTHTHIHPHTDGIYTHTEIQAVNG